jgi:hypothetical protein
MPKIYEYLGIVISFFSDEHEPIHVHAEYNGNVVKVSFFIKDGKIYRTTYSEITGKFPPAKMKVLKKFISLYKDNIIQEWTNFFILKKKVNFERITTKL